MIAVPSRSVLLAWRWAAIVLLTACLLPGVAGPAAAKPLPVVRIAFEGVPESVGLGTALDLVLRVTAVADAPDVTVEMVVAPEYEVVAGPVPWSGALVAGQTLDLPVTVRLTGSGEYALRGWATNRLPEGRTQGSGAWVSVIAGEGVARLSFEPHFVMKLQRARDEAELEELGISVPQAAPVEREHEPDLAVGPVTGTVRWTDCEGNTHPVRFARVDVMDGVPDGPVLVRTMTDANGMYAAGAMAQTNQVSVRVRTSDGVTGTWVRVYPTGQATHLYHWQAGPRPLGTGVVINLTIPRPVRGSVADSIHARAFSVFDAMVTHFGQAIGLLGATPPGVSVEFPIGGISHYSRADRRIHINRQDAMDWDVLGHEFFHFLNHQAAPRQIANSPGGSHSGGSAIGEEGRNRDGGLRLAWSEGLVTFMPIALQQAPAALWLPFPTNLAGVGDSNYEDTEDATELYSLENPPSSEGFASERSVMGLLWDLFDTHRDTIGTVEDRVSGGTARAVWNAITRVFPCDPCDRVDRFWRGMAGHYLAQRNIPAVLNLARTFVINRIAPRAVAPADGQALAGGLRPTFSWSRNGDPSAAHRNNRFILVFSRDAFQSHVVTVAVPNPDANSYQPSEAEWNRVLAGGRTNALYHWVVAGWRGDAPRVPETGYWYSNVMSFRARSLHLRITWNKVGADVDLHLSRPSGEDIAYYNRSPGWGFLDRDCISNCAVENISVAYFPDTGTYRGWAHYYSDHGHGAATVRAEVFNAGARVVDVTFTLNRTGDSRTFLSVSQHATNGVEVHIDGGGDAGGFVAPETLPPKPAGGP